MSLAMDELACYLSIYWISSHSKVKGNEKVDELAKEAAEGRSSARARLPHILRSPLPVSTSAIKQSFHSKIKDKWKDLWADSDRRQRVDPIDDNFPFNSFRNRTYQLSRNHASLMTQLRCGHIPLNGYLQRIGRSETDLCQSCLDVDNDIRCRETIKHFIFECTKYNQDREELVAKITRTSFNLKDIMSNTDHMRALAAYINRTDRFRKQ